MAVATSDITFSDSTPYSGETIDFEVNVRNIGHFPATDATISFYLVWCY